MNITPFKTPWGEGIFTWTKAGIFRLELEKPQDIAVADLDREQEPFGAVAQLEQYFAGQLRDFKFPLLFQGTEFQMKVWHGLQSIPYGEVWSYQQLAKKIGAPAATRAVGNANHVNPLPIIIPCHRVIRANGDLGGYGSGTAIKEWLLELEGSLRRPS